MKKTFIVEIVYEELLENLQNNADVLYDTALESTIEDMMYSYKQHGSIKGDYEVNVVETTPLKLEVKNIGFDLKTVYATPHGYENFKEGDSVWVTDKRLFDTDVEIKVSDVKILKFVEHNDNHNCDIFELTNKN